MKVMSVMKRAVGALCLLGLAQVASAGVISLVPNPGEVDIGDMITIDVVWDGTDGSYIGDFDIDVSFDNTIVEYVGGAVDPDFGIDSFGCVICDISEAGGVVDAYAVSFDSPADLMINQDGLGNVFKLASLEFKGLIEGVTDLLFEGPFLVFGDADGLPMDVTLNNGRICVGPEGCPKVDVPEPGPASLVLLGMLALGLRQLRRA